MAYVQAAGNSTPVSNTLVQAFGSNVGNNSTLLVMACRDNSHAFSSIVDTLGNDYGTALESITDSGNQEVFDVWIAKCPTGGANTVTVSHSSFLGDGTIIVVELSGRDTTTPTGSGKHAQANQSAPGTGANAISCGTITAATGDDLIMFMADTGAFRTGTFSAGTGYTERLENGSASSLDSMVQTLLNSSSGTKTGTATTANNDHVLSVVVAVTAGATVISGTGADTMTAPTDSGTGKEVFTGTGVDTVSGFSSTGGSHQAFVGTGVDAVSLSVFVSAGNGAIGQIITGVAILNTPDMTDSGSAAPASAGTGASTMTAPVDAGTAVEAFIGSAANTAAGPTDAGTGVEVLVGTGVDSIPAFANTGTAVEAFAGTGASNLSGFSDSGGSSQTATGFGSSLMSLPTDAGTGLFIAFNNAVGMGGSDLTPNFSDAGVGTFQVGPGPIPLKDAVDIAQATVFLLLSDRQINASLEKELQGLSIVLQVDENLQLLQEAVDYALYWARFLVADYQSDAGVIQDLLVLENVLTAAGAV